jgi:predicted nuclease of predicted toxin-antitoxin system
VKILIDENLPQKLKENFGDENEVYSVREMNWHGKKNGELLGLMTLAGFEGFIKMDKNLPSQQNLNKFAITIFVLRGIDNKLETLQELIPPVLERIKEGVDVGVVEIRK